MPNRPVPSSSRLTAKPAERAPPIRVGDQLALDFLNSIAAPHGVAIEWIPDGAALLEWLTGSGVIGRDEAKRIAADAPTRMLDRVANEAVELRERFRSIVARAKANGPEALAGDDIARLNSVLARDATVQRIERSADDGRLRIVADRRWRDPGALLVPVAAAMAALICTGDFALVHRCKNPPCTLWFYDRTKGHRRRWCSQTVCGNRAKVAAHRQRQRLAR